MSRTVTLKGNPLELAGEELRIGDKAPTARLRKDLLSDFNLSEASGKIRVYSVVPSLDTPVCAIQTKRFNKEAGALPNVEFYTISSDLPTAMGRFCGSESIDSERMHALSDHKYAEFGNAFGTLIPSLRIQCRAVFVVDDSDIIRHLEYVPEIADEPDYDALLSCLKKL